MDLLVIIGAVVVALLGALGIAFKKGGSSALAKRDAKQGKANEKLQQKFDKIDSGSPNVDASIDRLSKRAGGNPKP
jgi:hypothetical protein